MLTMTADTLLSVAAKASQMSKKVKEDNFMPADGAEMLLTSLAAIAAFLASQAQHANELEVAADIAKQFAHLAQFELGADRVFMRKAAELVRQWHPDGPSTRERIGRVPEPVREWLVWEVNVGWATGAYDSTADQDDTGYVDDAIAASRYTYDEATGMIAAYHKARFNKHNKRPEVAMVRIQDIGL